ILINDGSNDATEQYLSKIHNHNKKVIVFNQENLGVSAARNTGIRNADNDYIIFIDDDDDVTVNIFNVLNKEIIENNYPYFIRFSGIIIDKNGGKTSIKGFESNVDIIEQITNPKRHIDCYTPLLAIKNKNIKKFREDLKYLEDDVFYLDNLSRKSIRIVTIPNKLYTYRYNEASKTKNINNYEQNFNDLVKSGETMMRHRALTRRQSFYTQSKICNLIFWKTRIILAQNGTKKARKLAKIGYKNLKDAKIKPSIITPKSLLKYYLIKLFAL
ncbi:MAG: glycosyltransferase, partial [Candidatus Saccharibacteria bacterium]|nr:glycosyltransferase [Candidatus Saccharibacteria bacterium]